MSVNGTRAYCAVLCSALNTCTHSHQHSPEHMQILCCHGAGCKYYHYFLTLLSFFQFTSRRCCFVSFGSSWKLSATWQNLLPKILIRKLRNTEYSACPFSCWPNYKIVCWFSAKCHIMSEAGARALACSSDGTRCCQNNEHFRPGAPELAGNKQRAKICKLNKRIICEKYYILIALTIYISLQYIFENVYKLIEV